LLLQLKNYRKALDAIREDVKIDPRGMNYERVGMVYEYLGEKESAKEKYRLAIDAYKNELKDNPNSDFIITEIATLSMIIGDTITAREYLMKRKPQKTSEEKALMQRQNKLIMSYKSGGLLWFVEQAKKH